MAIQHENWRLEAYEVVDAMSAASLELLTPEITGQPVCWGGQPGDQPFTNWLAFVAEFAALYVKHTAQAWLYIKDRVNQPAFQVLFDHVVNTGSRRAERLEYILTYKYPLLPLRREYTATDLRFMQM
jgi:hypothetical protein